MKIEPTAIIKAYEDGQSLNAIARTFGTYATTIKRILERNNIELRHDGRKEGEFYVEDGEKLIEWAESQGRLVTKAELAHIVGKKRLSPSYFLKYPELGRYIEISAQNELQTYYEMLYKWLQDNHIPYKPNDRTKLGVSVDALLLGKYSNVVICISEKPKCISKNKHRASVRLKAKRAKEAGVTIIFLDKEYFRDLNKIKDLLNDLKK